MINHRQNCFDSLRHLAAFLVLFSHNYALHGFKEPTFFGIHPIGGVGLVMFFSISGFLITKSLLSSKSNKEFIKKRALRLLPALILCSFLLTYFYCGLLGRESFFHWISSFESFKTFLFYSTTARYEFFTVTSNYIEQDFRYQPFLNGPLWSLFYEILDYSVLLILFLFFKKSSKSCLIILIPSILIQFFLNYSDVPNTKIFDPSLKYFNYLINEYLYKSTLLSIPFFSAAFFYFKSEWFLTNKKTSILISSCILLIAILIPKYTVFYLVGLSILTLILGLSFKDYIIRGKFDYSYGIYIYAWPIQQFFANFIKLDFFSSLIASIFFTLIFASMSWHCVEKIFIKKNKSLILKSNVEQIKTSNI